MGSVKSFESRGIPRRLSRDTMACDEIVPATVEHAIYGIRISCRRCSGENPHLLPPPRGRPALCAGRGGSPTGLDVTHTDQPDSVLRPEYWSFSGFWVIGVRVVGSSGEREHGPQTLRHPSPVTRHLRPYGSSASLNPSPTKLMEITVRKIIRPGAMAKTGRACMCGWASRSRLPQVAVGGCTP